MSTDDGISVVIPARNSAGTINATLRSIAAQTRPVQEVIVVDDGSTDATAEVARSIPDLPVRIVPGAGRGAGPARNLGVSVASNPLIAFVDSDDMWYPTKLEEQLPLLDDGAAFVGALIHYVNDRGDIIGTNFGIGTWREATASLRAGLSMPLAMSTYLMRRSVFEDSGGFDESFLRTEDFELASRLVANGLEIRWPYGRALTAYRLHPGGVTAKTYEEQFLAAALVHARRSGRATPSYSEWLDAPELSARERLEMRSGRHYRHAAVEIGRRRPVPAVGHATAAVLWAPWAVLRKARSSRTGRGEVTPRTVPAQVKALLADTIDH